MDNDERTARSSSRRCRRTQAFETRHGRALDPLRDRGPRDRAVHRHRQRISADGLDPCRPWRSGRSASPRRAGPVRGRLRVSKRGVAGPWCADRGWASPRRAASSRRSGSARSRRSRRRGPEAGFKPERTQVRLVRQGLTGHPFWAVSFSVPAPSGDGFAKLTTVRIDANTGDGRGRQSGALTGSSSPSRRASHGAGAACSSSVATIASATIAGEPVDVRHAEPGEHADERRGHDAGLARPAQERELVRDPAGARDPAARTRAP